MSRESRQEYDQFILSMPCPTCGVQGRRCVDKSRGIPLRFPHVRRYKTDEQIRAESQEKRSAAISAAMKERWARIRQAREQGVDPHLMKVAELAGVSYDEVLSIINVRNGEAEAAAPSASAPKPPPTPTLPYKSAFVAGYRLRNLMDRALTDYVRVTLVKVRREKKNLYGDDYTVRAVADRMGILEHRLVDFEEGRIQPAQITLSFLQSYARQVGARVACVVMLDDEHKDTLNAVLPGDDEPREAV